MSYNRGGCVRRMNSNEILTTILERFDGLKEKVNTLTQVSTVVTTLSNQIRYIDEKLDKSLTVK